MFPFFLLIVRKADSGFSRRLTKHTNINTIHRPHSFNSVSQSSEETEKSKVIKKRKVMPV